MILVRATKALTDMPRGRHVWVDETEPRIVSYLDANLLVPVGEEGWDVDLPPIIVEGDIPDTSGHENEWMTVAGGIATWRQLPTLDLIPIASNDVDVGGFRLVNGAPGTDPTDFVTLEQLPSPLLPSVADGPLFAKHDLSGWQNRLIVSTDLPSHHALHEPGGADAIDWGGTVLRSGLEASRPAASASNAGAYWESTDLGVRSQSDGSSWIPRGTRPGWISSHKAVYESLRGGRMAAGTNFTLTSGTPMFVGIEVPAGAVLVYIGMRINATTFSTGGTDTGHWYFELRDLLGNLLAWTTDQGNTGLGTSGWKKKQLIRDVGGGVITSYTNPTTRTLMLGVVIDLGNGTGGAMGSIPAGTVATGMSAGGDLDDMLQATGVAGRAGTCPTTETLTNGSSNQIYARLAAS